MAAGTFYPAASGDDTSWRVGFWESIDLKLQTASGVYYKSAIRFPNVSIPQGASITNAFVRLTSRLTRADDVDIVITANDEDDAVAPTNITEGEALVKTTANTAWGITTNWVANTQYDTPSLVDEVQEVVDRVGWSSGNALQIIFTSVEADSVQQQPYSYDHDPAKVAELHVTWTADISVACEPLIATASLSSSPQLQIPLTDTPDAANSLHMASVYIGNYVVCEPLIAGASMSANIQRQIGLAPLEIVSNTLAAVQRQIPANPLILAASLNVSSIFIGKYLLLEPLILASNISPGSIQQQIPLAALALNTGISSVPCLRIPMTAALELGTGMSLEVWDGAAWRAWVEAYGNQCVKLYYCTLTGDADGKSDLAIPMSSFQARRKSGDPTFVAVVTPGTDLESRIEARANGTLEIEMAYVLNGVEEYRETIMTADLDGDNGIRSDKGGRNQSITLMGHKTETFVSKVTWLQDVTYKRDINGDLAYRCASCDLYLNPGDTAKYGSDSFTVNQIVLSISPELQTMEVEESAT